MELPKINLPPIDLKYKIAGIIGIIALVLGFYYDHAYKPNAKKIEDARQEMLSLDDTLGVIRTVDYPQAKDDAAILVQIEQKKKKLQDQIKTEEAKLPAKSDMSKILQKITDIAYESGFDIKSMEPKDFASKENYQSMTLTMEMSTNYKNITEFIEKISELSVYPEYLEMTVDKRPLLTIRFNLSILFK